MPRRRPGPASILLVEDELVVREARRRDAGRRRVRGTAPPPTPQQALEIAVRHGSQIDLVITDLVMPGMNGHRLAERLEEIRPGTPVLFTSGYPGEDVVRDGVLGTGRRFLPKPFTAAELETAARIAARRGAGGANRACDIQAAHKRRKCALIVSSLHFARNPRESACGGAVCGSRRAGLRHARVRVRANARGRHGIRARHDRRVHWMRGSSSKRSSGTHRAARRRGRRATGSSSSTSRPVEGRSSWKAVSIRWNRTRVPSSAAVSHTPSTTP